MTQHLIGAIPIIDDPTPDLGEVRNAEGKEFLMRFPPVESEPPLSNGNKKDSAL